VQAGQLLGRSGASGDVVKPHLHFVVTRVKDNEEVSEPVRFYVGVPPVAFAPRAALTATANYSGPAEVPRTPLEAATFAGVKRPVPVPEEEGAAWLRLSLWLAAGVAGMAWFWRFSRKS
jgi:murein DD-endopeptidase MepM/ murein hydrolase activator NlpD